MNTATALNAYTNVGIESSVSAADPYKLILLLYQGALLAIAAAKNQIARNEVAAKGKSIGHAITIIDQGLRTSLNTKVGGELAQNLDSLYAYMSQRLLTANLNNDVAALDEVSGLLTELRSAWESMDQSTANQSSAAAPKAAPITNNHNKQQAALVYGRM